MSSESLNILRVVGSTYPEVVGGVGLHVHHMSRCQAALGHEVTVLTSDNGDRSLPRRETRAGYQVRRHREVARPFDNTIIPGVGVSLHRDLEQYDVLHIHSHLYFSSNVAALLSRLHSVPTVVTNHGLVSQTAPGTLQKLFNATLGKLTFEAADSVLCYTETDKQRLRARGIETRISVLPNGVDCSQFKPDGTAPRRHLLFVGRLKRGKGPHHLLDAFSEIAPAYPDLSLRLVGDGPLRPALERQAESLGIAPRVEFLGEVPNDELPPIYNGSLAFVLPSLTEGLPRTVLEAMACGTPVVTSDLEQLRPIVEGVGYTATPGSATELASALAALVEADQATAFGERARERVVRDHAWQATVERTIDEYRRLIEA